MQQFKSCIGATFGLPLPAGVNGFRHIVASRASVCTLAFCAYWQKARKPNGFLRKPKKPRVYWLSIFSINSTIMRSYANASVSIAYNACASFSIPARAGMGRGVRFTQLAILLRATNTRRGAA